METPLNKCKGSAFQKYNMFHSSASKIIPNELIFNSNVSYRDNYHLISDPNFSFRKFIKSSDKKETSKETPGNNFSPVSKIFKDKENLVKLSCKCNCLKINNVNFDINFSYFK